ncbi:conjugal transfer protein TraD [Xanthomonas axonopodis pv. khayae]|uniref:conjugal transfer protein TraD n=1 Tax=Xanthomonas axonopodis TaxID=53413 RepID=UPI0009961ACD|nr:conjugal transfer protein TraD [Xanthomonas axonopodis]
MANVEKQKLKLDRMVEALAREQAKLLLAEREEQRKRRRAELKQREEERRADAHRKIELGGLVIAAGADELNEAEIVGALLAMVDRFASHPGFREQVKERGIRHLEARKAAREASRS